MNTTEKNVNRNPGNWKLLVLLLYVAIGLFLAFIDTKVLAMYITVLPLQFLFLVYGYKSKNILLFLFFLLMFLTQGVNPVFFFLERETYSATGFKAVGNFDFSLSRYYMAYSYVFAFCLALIMVDALLNNRRKRKDHIIPYIKTFTSKFASRNTEKSEYLFYLILFTILMSMLSLWMYNNQIGLIGLKQKSLPFRLSGILFYFRRYFASAIVVYLYVKCKNKNAALGVVVIYSLIIGISGSSRSAAAITLLPIAGYSFILNDKVKGVITIIIYSIIYTFIATCRVYIFAYDYITFSIPEVISLALDSFGSSDENMFISFMSGFTGRLYGSCSLVLMEQQDMATINDLIKWYLTGKYNFDFLAMHGIKFNQDMDYAFGVGEGYTGFMTLLSCHNQFLSILQGVIMALLFYSLNNNIQKLVTSRAWSMFKLLALAALGMGLMFLWDGHIASFYVCGILTLLLRYLWGNKRYIYAPTYTTKR